LFCLVGGPAALDELAQHVVDVGRDEAWTAYTQGWKDARINEQRRKKDHALGSSPLAVWQGRAPEDEAELSLAHSVVTHVLHDNPLLGSGGAARRRNFADGWRDAVSAIQARNKKGQVDVNRRERVEADLTHFLKGEACSELGWWNAGSWFSQANKLYNFDASKPYVKGEVTPWGMVLACEGLVVFAGSPSRRLGVRARSRGAFPFVTGPPAPQTAGTLRHDTGEAWLPVWGRPMTLPEVRSLFLRGRAELGGRGAVTPAAFAAAVVRRGVDAGIDAFARFSLGQTTNRETFEPRYAGMVSLPSSGTDDATASARASAAEGVVEFIESLPLDQRVTNRERFLGLRGPVEAALTRFAGSPGDPEAAGRLLDAVAHALDRVDRHRKHRTHGVRWRLLPLTWLPELFGDSPVPREARLAMGLASIGAYDSADVGPLVNHRWGVECRPDGRARRLMFPETTPARRIWTHGAVEDDLARVLHRRLVDTERVDRREDRQSTDGRETRPALPLAATVSLRQSDVATWLSGDADGRLIARWLDRLVLFDWRNWSTVPDDVRSLASATGATQLSSLLRLYGLFRPLLDPRDVTASDGEPLLPTASGARTLGAARRITTLIAAGQMDAAVTLAFTRYRMAGRPPADFPLLWGRLDHPTRGRLLGGLLLQPY
jgi:CRISPR-associated protein Csx17